MKIGIGIDTGGTCTDAVIYQFEQRKIIACAKTNTTKEDLSKGIAEVLKQLPVDQREHAEVIALSTTLATNACVENKGGRAKLIFFGVNPENVARVGREYGLSREDAIFVDCKTRTDGQILRQPDWDTFRIRIREELQDCEAVAVVEMFARKSGALMEKKARRIIEEELHILVVCGYELFGENNIIKRGASTLLNARLISVIREFISAVKLALEELKLDVPIVIVRSDGSLMSESFAEKHPIETLLCGPVASVMGAAELTAEQNCIVADMGGTTTDVALIKDGIPQAAENGVSIGKWNTFVKGMFVDTFGLGGDSAVELGPEKKLTLLEERVMPICMVASRFPEVKELLRKSFKDRTLMISPNEELYLGLRDISDRTTYTKEEKDIAALLLGCPTDLEHIGRQLNRKVLHRHLERLIREGILIRCGLTPTDAMHVLGDFTKYDTEAAEMAAERMGRVCGKSGKALCHAVYDEVKKKLYFNLVRVLLENSFPLLKRSGIDEQTAALISNTWDENCGELFPFLETHFSTKTVLIGVGAPAHIFLPDVGERLHAKTITPQFSQVANALGAIVGNVSARVIMEVVLNQKENNYTVFGRGERYSFSRLEEAKRVARQLAEEKARKEAAERGAGTSIQISFEECDNIVNTDFGPLFMGYKVSAIAVGEICLIEKERKNEGKKEV